MKRNFIFIVLLTLIFLFTGCEDFFDDNDDEEIGTGEKPVTLPDTIKTLKDEIIEILEAQEGTKDNPALLVWDFEDKELGDMLDFESNWHTLLIAIETAGKYVELDLSACTLNEQPSLRFNPNGNIPNGKDLIVRLILPDIATNIAGIGSQNQVYAFKYFTNLENISGANIIHIGETAFFNCTNLKEVYFPLVKEIIDGAFSGCTSLIEADFPLAEILGNNTFDNCKNLKYVNLPNIKKFPSDAFNNCIGLETINLQSAIEIVAGTFSNLTSLKTINLQSVTAIPEGTFRNLTKLKTINLPKITTIYKETFFGCTGLEKITEDNFPSVVHIADNAFNGCTNLTEVVFLNVSKIEPYAFSNCTSLVTARFLGNPERANPPTHPLQPLIYHGGVMPEGVVPYSSDSMVIHHLAFNGCTSLEVLDVRNAWNVYFEGRALANTGFSLDLYLFDDDGTECYGHPQIDALLGREEALTINTIKIYAPNVNPETSSQIEKRAEPGDFHGIFIQLEDTGTFGNLNKEVIRE